MPARVSRVTETGARTTQVLLGLDTGLLSDALEGFEGGGVPRGIRALSASPRRIAGRAVTVQLGPAGTGVPAIHLGARAIDAATAGDVIVVANDGRVEMAAWGGLLSAVAAARGVSGVVIDGACRDVEDHGGLDLEVFCKGAVPVTARGRIAERAVGEPVRIAGVRIQPGDWIVGDATGIVVVPADRIEDVVAVAGRLYEHEARLRDRIVAGEPASGVLGASYESLLQEER